MIFPEGAQARPGKVRGEPRRPEDQKISPNWKFSDRVFGFSPAGPGKARGKPGRPEDWKIPGSAHIRKQQQHCLALHVQFYC